MTPTTLDNPTRAEAYLKPEVARRVRRLDLRARFIVEGFWAGLHASRERGHSLEFAEHRVYAPGDDPRALDWKTWARTDRLTVRTYRAETSLAAYLVMDTSGSMAWASRPGAMTKLEYATALAAALGYLLVYQHDAVGLALVGTGIEALVRPRTGRRQLVRVLARLARTQGGGPTRLAAGLTRLAEHIHRRSLVVVLSDFLDDPDAVLAAMARLARAGHQVMALQVMDPAERTMDLAGPVILEDPETGERLLTDADSIRDAYAARVAEFVDRLERGVRGMGGDFAAMTTDTSFDVALARFLRGLA
jgi:uncharacterized protein (DUF58 family)